jgi:hypothetical protein
LIRTRSASLAPAASPSTIPQVAAPARLDSRLPPLPGSHRRYFVGRDLIVVDSLTNVVMTILRDVLS